jgi:hypothetical protein
MSVEQNVWVSFGKTAALSAKFAEIRRKAPTT